MEELLNHKDQLDEIMAGMQCQRDFNCHKENFAHLCEVKIINSRLIECKSANLEICEHAVSFGLGHFCQCPLRKYIANQMGK